MLIKYEITLMKIGQVTKLQTDSNFSETPCISQMILNFLKHLGS